MAFAQLVVYVGEGPEEFYKLKKLVELYELNFGLHRHPISSFYQAQGTPPG